MPIYSYRCKDGHIEDEIRSYDEINNPHECSVCGEPSFHILKAPPKEEKIERASGPASYIRWYTRKCLDCEVTYDGSYDLREEGAGEDKNTCPSCKSENTRKSMAVHSIDTFSCRFPYYDRGLGMVLKSKQHRRNVCSERGLVPVDGDFDINDMNREERARIAEDKRIVQRLEHNMKHNPAFAEYRRYKANGWDPKFIHRRKR